MLPCSLMPVVLFAEEAGEIPNFLEQHSGEITILLFSAMVLGTLLVLTPVLVRSHLRSQELMHEEHMRALEQGYNPPRTDDRSRLAGRAASLVPTVVISAAGTVTCFLAAYRSESLFSVSLVVWSVAGGVSLAAITGCVALMGRIAQLQAGFFEDSEEEIPEDHARR